MEPQADNVIAYRGPLAIGNRRILGMPGPVWTMALWFAAGSAVLSVSLLFPMNPNAPTAARALVMAYAVGVVIASLVMRDRTPAWFLHLQAWVAITATLWLVHVSVMPVGAVTTAINLIAVAAYLGFWFPMRVAVIDMAIAFGALLAVFASDMVNDGVGLLLVPWALITALSLGLLLSFGTLVSHMQRQLVTDPLTGLLNRSALATIIDADGDRATMTQPRTLMVIDLDQFKAINDREGHLAGDVALQQFSTALRGILRPADIALRTGGDEFVLILPGTDEAASIDLAHRLCAATALEWSYGVADWPAGESYDAAVARADRGMYEQKAGRSAHRRDAE
ncbi:MAG: GGDEF domain-containing protein [Candidatus Nanopelagicales bacterium]